MSEEKKTHPEHIYSVTFVSKIGTKRLNKSDLIGNGFKKRRAITLTEWKKGKQSEKTTKHTKLQFNCCVTDGSSCLSKLHSFRVSTVAVLGGEMPPPSPKDPSPADPKGPPFFKNYFEISIFGWLTLNFSKSAFGDK